MGDLALAGALAVIMVSMGLALTVDDFARVVKAPKAFLVGTTSQVLALPALAFLIASVLPLDPVMKVGLVVLAACPGGVTSSLLTHLAKGDTALSISLTSVISVFSFITIPLIVSLALGHYLGAEAPPLPILDTQITILAITVVPLAIGMLVNAKVPRVANRIEPTARRLATLLFLLVVAAAYWADRDKIAEHVAAVGPAVLLLNVAAMGLGYGVAVAARLNRGQGIAISLECGLQNGTLAIFICSALLGSVTMAVPAALYSLAMFATAGLFILFLARGGRFGGA
ncbi:MAG: hypothetical protein RLY86_803 [Pseudomonadota bacterium]|jgi:BASS family bile acid:Na+ symporter